MQFNPFDLKDGQMMWERYDFFKRRPIYHSPNDFLSPENERSLHTDDWNSVLRFLVLFVDEQSPFKKERDFSVRKLLCFEALSIETDSEAMRIVNAEGSLYKQALFLFFKDMSPKYKLWFAKTSSLNTYYQRLVDVDTSVDNIEKAIDLNLKIDKVIKDLTDEIIVIEADLFNDVRMKQIIKESAAEDEMTGYVEKHAKRLIF